jgi:hypothetical protein
VIIEVLSPSTEGYDCGERWACYQQLASLTDYLLVSQEQAQVEYYLLEADGTWRYLRSVGSDSCVTPASINCRLPLAEVYGGVEFPPPKPDRRRFRSFPREPAVNKQQGLPDKPHLQPKPLMARRFHCGLELARLRTYTGRAAFAAASRL